MFTERAISISAFKDAPRSPVSNWAMYTRDNPAKSANCSCERPVLARVALTILAIAASSPGKFSIPPLYALFKTMLYALAYKMIFAYGLEKSGQGA